MLEALRSGDFAPHIGKPCRLTCGDIVIDTVLDAVGDNPLARHPQASADSRTPFMLVLRGDADCPWGDGTFVLHVDGMEKISGVFVNRILNTGAVPGSLFQAVFN